ncbi:Tfp pilus assembly protein FimT/FimU [Polynucleobacter sp. Fuers-14]|uniref:pilus assembly FimT family protein n=1 Tax=Polynucleobacter sp. Fuers-14 TaxID=1758364 RepID=UPI001C0D504D|nr:prepilin-type N-terminal cleavage/methylation domain-containing protein [Polynucleobacter sp. Fuers-14]MBU3641348.1 prepilin-type N-terminal cleavage/methylation domain-containing protein [Polynucleobacter sp. Fuers-14]
MLSRQFTTAHLRNPAEGGFTLVEMLVAITILAIMMAVAILAIPNHDDRYWRDNLDQLVSSLNMAQEESNLSGTTMLVQVDEVGWRFAPALNNAPVSALINAAGSTANPGANSSGLMPDVYRPQLWHKPVVIEPVQFTLGGETITQAMQVPIAQEQRKAILSRSTNGRFSWTGGVQ